MTRKLRSSSFPFVRYLLVIRLRLTLREVFSVHCIAGKNLIKYFTTADLLHMLLEPNGNAKAESQGK